MIPIFKVFMSNGVSEAVSKTLMSGYIGQGEKVNEFEMALRPWISSDKDTYPITTNSATSALHLALHISGVGQNTDVVTTPMTCLATNVSIKHLGANIIWADIIPDTGEIDPNDVEEKITHTTKAVICVNWGGYPCNLQDLRMICRKHNIKLIQDAAHSFGALYHGLPVSDFSDFTIYSFQAIKHLTTGDGGALVCAHREDYEKAKLLRWYGLNRESNQIDMRCEQDVKEIGYKFHMNDINATIGIENLKCVKGIIRKHRKNAAFYDQNLEIDKPLYKPTRLSSYWFYPIKVNNSEGFIRYVKSENIQVSRVHSRNDMYTALYKSRAYLPGTDEFCRRQVNLPCGWWLNELEIEKIMHTVRMYSEQKEDMHIAA